MRKLIHQLWDTGLRLRCPVCEQGRLFDDWFTMNPVCPHCSVRFERYEGEVVGGMSISIVVTAFIFLVGYFSLVEITDWPTWLHLTIWLLFATLFPILFYRYSRALWVVLLHLSGDVHWDYEPYDTPTLSIVDAFVNPDGNVPDEDATLQADDDPQDEPRHPHA